MIVYLSREAEKQYHKLPKKEQSKIKKKLLLLEQDELLGKKLTGKLYGIRSFRAWPYRILYEINEKKRRIEVHKIAQRQGVYK